jgi:hypothetical protein
MPRRNCHTRVIKFFAALSIASEEFKVLIRTWVISGYSRAIFLEQERRVTFFGSAADRSRRNASVVAQNSHDDGAKYFCGVSAASQSMSAIAHIRLRTSNKKARHEPGLHVDLSGSGSWARWRVAGPAAGPAPAS